MDIQTFQELQSQHGQSALALAHSLNPTDKDYLHALATVRKTYTPALATAAIETVLLRERAKVKFAQAANMYFTREALEQATSEVVANHRAKRFIGYQHVLDLCCGIGGDAIALAGAGCRMTAFDTDAVRVAMARENAKVCGVEVEVICADVLSVNMPIADAVFCDPNRRVNGRRALDLADYEPAPQDVVKRFAADVPLAFKLAPGVPWETVQDWGGEVEFVSLHGEMKECVLWLGALAKDTVRATVLPTGDSLVAQGQPILPEVGPIGRYFYDPDPAVVRAGLTGELSEILNANALDARVGLLTGQELKHTPFAIGYEVEDYVPFHEKRFGACLKEKNIGRVTIVKRGGPDVDVNDLLKRWKLKGDEHRKVFLTKVGGESKAVVVRD